MRQLVCIALFLIFSSCAWAHTGSVSGKIYNNETGQPLSNVNVVVNAEKSTTTDIFGYFKISGLKPGNYILKISYVGLKTIEKPIEVREDENAQILEQLTPSSIVLADVTINTGHTQNLSNISALDIELRPVQTSQDVLRLVPGLFIAQHAGGGKAEQIFLRGFDIDHGTDINLSVDGIPVNMVSHAHGQGYSDLHFLIPETIENVDFNKGMYYADKGDFTTAGYAAFHTKKTLDKSRIKIEGGQFGTFRTVAMVDLLGKNNDELPERKQSAYVASEYYMTNGYFNSPQNFNRLNIFAKYNQYIGDDKLLTASFSTFSSKWDASGQIPERAVKSGMIGRFGAIDDTEGGETSRANLNLQFINNLSNRTAITHQLYFTRYNFNLVSNFTFFLNNPEEGDQITQSESRNMYGYKGSFFRELQFLGKETQLEIGAGFRYDDVNDIRLSNTVNRKEVIRDLSRGNIDQTNLYAYVNETLELTSRLSLNAALRFDHFVFNYVDALATNYERRANAKSMVSPKLNLNYKLGPNTSVYVKSGMGFHSNDTRVVVAQQGEKIIPKAYGLDLGATFKPTRSLVVNAALWLLDLEQEFVYVGDEAVVEAGGATRRQGIDFSARYQAIKWLFVDVDLNFTNPKSKDDPEGQNYIPLAPIFTSIGGLSVKLDNGINSSLRYRYIANRPANEDYSIVADGYFLVDAVLNYTQPWFEVGLSIENILNAKWKEAQFDTESRLSNEIEAVSEIHFTPGTPFFLRANVSYFF